MRHNLGTIDLDTGEVFEGLAVWVKAKASPYGRRFFMVNQEALLAIAKDKEFTQEPYRVFTLLCVHLDYDNWIQIARKDIAEALEMKGEAVSRAIRLLLRKGVIFRGPKAGSTYSFRLNPCYGYKGKLSHIRQGAKGLHLVGAE